MKVRHYVCDVNHTSEGLIRRKDACIQSVVLKTINVIANTLIFVVYT